MKTKRIIISILTLLPFSSLYAEKDTALFAGTLLSFYAQNAEPGRLSVQPYLFSGREWGIYGPDGEIAQETNIHSTQLLVSFESGITKKVDLALVVNLFEASSDQLHRFSYGDTGLYLGYQIWNGKKNSWRPDFRLVIGEIFPTGKFDNLLPQGLAADSSGTGAFETFFGLIMRKIFYNIPNHPYNFNINLFYALSTETSVRNFSFYGGGIGTRGTVRPGDQFIANFAFEYTLIKNWGIGMDFRYEHQDKSPFFASPSSTGPLAGLPSTDRWSLAPCIEYVRDENFSWNVGAWFTIAGRNTFAFTDLAATVYYYF